MKNFLLTIAALCYAIAANAGETWRIETYESGESVYISGYTGAFNTLFLVGENGVGIIYRSASAKSLADGIASISINGSAEIPIQIEQTPRSIYAIKNSLGLANALANATTAKLKIRVCDWSACNFAKQGGKFQDLTWEWDEPLSKTFPNFRPYQLR